MERNLRIMVRDASLRRCNRVRHAALSFDQRWRTSHASSPPFGLSPAPRFHGSLDFVSAQGKTSGHSTSCKHFVARHGYSEEGKTSLLSLTNHEANTLLLARQRPSGQVLLPRQRKRLPSPCRFQVDTVEQEVLVFTEVTMPDRSVCCSGIMAASGCRDYACQVSHHRR